MLFYLEQHQQRTSPNHIRFGTSPLRKPKTSASRIGADGNTSPIPGTRSSISSLRVRKSSKMTCSRRPLIPFIPQLIHPRRASQEWIDTTRRSLDGRDLMTSTLRKNLAFLARSVGRNQWELNKVVYLIVGSYQGCVPSPRIPGDWGESFTESLAKDTLSRVSSDTTSGTTKNGCPSTSMTVFQ